MTQRDKAPQHFEHLHASIHTSSFNDYALQHHNITNQNAPTKNYRSPDHSRDDRVSHRTSKATLLISSRERKVQQRFDPPLRSFLPAPASIARRVRKRRAWITTQEQTILIDHSPCGGGLVINKKNLSKSARPSRNPLIRTNSSRDHVRIQEKHGCRRVYATLVEVHSESMRVGSKFGQQRGYGMSLSRMNHPQGGNHARWLCAMIKADLSKEEELDIL